MDKAFDVEKDSLDLENGGFTWKGRTFNVGSSRMARARFEKYLALNPDDEGLGEYQAILNEISAQLSAANDDMDPSVLFAAWKRLFDAAEYAVDGDASMATANLVYLAWRMRDEYRIFAADEYEKSRFYEQSRRNLESMSTYFEFARDKSKRGSSKSNVSKNTRTEGESRIVMQTEDMKNAFEDLAASRITKEAAGAKAVVQFQSQILIFTAARKFQSAQIASMFYRHIYRGNAQDLRVGVDEIKAIYPSAQLVPTVDVFENSAREARSEIRDGMVAVNNLYDSGDKYSALQRLMETFLLGEYDYYVRLFDYSKKSDLLKIYRALSTIKDLSDSKDWNGVEELVSEMKSLAKDFPYREVLSKVQAAKKGSDLHLLSAKHAALSGDKETLASELKEAAKLWPLNPGISEFSSEMVGMAMGSMKYVEKFDELYEKGNYREIVEEGPEYGLAFRTDKDRAAKLKDAIVKITRVDSILAQAAELEKQQNPYFAWDILENALEVEPNDPVLARARAKLAPAVADYVKLLSDAEAAEKRGDYAVSLNLYLAAQDIFPASRLCRMGIERVAPRYMSN